MNATKRLESTGPPKETRTPSTDKVSVAGRVRFSWDVPAETNATLERLTQEMNVRSKADVLRKAVSLLLLVHEQQSQGKNLGIVSPQGQLVNLITLL